MKGQLKFALCMLKIQFMFPIFFLLNRIQLGKFSTDGSSVTDTDSNCDTSSENIIQNVVAQFNSIRVQEYPERRVLIMNQIRPKTHFAEATFNSDSL